MNQLCAAGSLNDHLLDATDADHLRRLTIYNVPPPITQWDGWYYPTTHDLTRIHSFIKVEESKNILLLNHPNWLLVSESPLEPYHHCRQASDMASPWLPMATGSSLGPGTLTYAPLPDHNRDSDCAIVKEYSGQEVGYNNSTTPIEPEQGEWPDVNMENTENETTLPSS